MKPRLMYSDYNPKTGLSAVVIKTENGCFRGTSQLNIEDKDIASRFAGCDYAFSKAVRKSLKQDIKNINLKIKTLLDFEKTLKNMKSYNPYSFEMKRLRKEVYILNKQKKDIEKEIQGITAAMIKAMEERPQKIKKIESRSQEVEKILKEL